MNIDYDDVEMQFKCTVTFTAKLKQTVHKHADLSKIEEEIIDAIYENPQNYMDDLEVTEIERII